MVTGATLTLQASLTRLFSVIFLYHLALVAVSAAMFGLAVGAVLVHSLTRLFPEEQSAQRSGESAGLMGIATLISLLGCLYVPFPFTGDWAGIAALLAWIGFVVAPFILSGVTVCLSLTRFPSIVGKLYAADLAGAALGCLLATAIMSWCGPINAILGAAVLAAAGGSLMVKTRRFTVASVTGLLTLVWAANLSTGFLRIHYILGEPYKPNAKYEMWNAFSHILVTQPQTTYILSGPGSRFEPDKWDSQYRMIFMDTRAATRLVKFSGDFNAVEWLRYDITSLAHELRPTGPVLVIGPGGGRDILAALLPSKGNRPVTGVEINPLTRQIVLEKEREYDGLYLFPQLQYINDEARSWLERSSGHYQVITVPMVDTFASTSAGAFVLSENSLYTEQAFRLYLRHLEPGGILSVSRWWHQGDLGETHRLLILAAKALALQGIKEPRQHLIIALGGEVANLLMSVTPFTAEDEEKLTQACRDRGFEVLLSPHVCRDHRFLTFLDDPSIGAGWFGKAYLDLSPPTDDRPYFFHCYGLRNLWSGDLATATGVSPSERDAMVILSALVAGAGLLVVVFWTWPMARARSASQRVLISYFGLLGFGFMFFESAQLQRMSLFLGYPIYSLSVVLFALLVASAFGSYWTDRSLRRGTFSMRGLSLSLLIGLIAIHYLSQASQIYLTGLSTSLRILVAFGLTAVAGIPLGVLFPLGVHVSKRFNVPLSWAWALNGAASAAGAVFAIAISLSYGITLTYGLCFTCYCLALLIISRYYR